MIRPMLAKKDNSDSIPTGGFVYETKWDGIRALIEWDQGNYFHIYSRHGREITEQFPEISLEDIRESFCPIHGIVDAEIVCLKDGIPHFPSVTSRLHLKTGRAQAAVTNPITVMVFDVLSIEHNSVMDEPLMARKRMLSGMLLPGRPFELSRVYENGERLYDKEQEKGAEGIIAKRRDSLYLPGRRTRDWLKIKIMYEEEVTCYGFSDGKGKREGLFGALLFKDLKGKPAGNVGTGFTDEELRVMMDFLHSRGARMKSPGVWVLESPFNMVVKGMRKNESGAIREPVFIKVTDY